MLKFFRKIRRKLLDEGNLKKYFVYAIGEILLVVIGILIALWINNINQQRIESKKGIEYLGRIQSDLAKDTITVLSHKRIINSKANILVNILHLNLDSITYFGERHGIFITRFRDPLFLNTNALDELINSGNISLIRNVELREKITNHYTVWKGVSQAIQKNTLGNYPSLFSEIIPGEEQYKARIQNTEYENIEGLVEIMKAKLLENHEKLVPAINAELGYAATRVSFYNEIYKETITLMTLIEQELKMTN